MKTKPIYLKEFISDEAQRLGVSSTCIFNRIQKGEYKDKIRLEKKSTRTILVHHLQPA